MRRILLLAGVMTALAGGAAALAATPDAGAPAATPPDPYLGVWALSIDGTLAGPVSRVDGCSLQAQLVAERPGPGKHIAAAAPQPCEIDTGGAMGAGFYSLVNEALGGSGRTHRIELTRIDRTPGYALRLENAAVTAVTLPKLDHNDVRPVFLHVSLGAEQVRRVPGDALPKVAPVRGFDARRFAVTVDGQPLRAAVAGPWTAKITRPDGVGERRDHELVPATVDVGGLPLRVVDSTPYVAGLMEPWAQAVLVDGQNKEAQVSVQMPGLQLAFDKAAPQRADLAARADGNRSYDLYTEQASLSPS